MFNSSFGFWISLRTKTNLPYSRYIDHKGLQCYRHYVSSVAKNNSRLGMSSAVYTIYGSVHYVWYTTVGLDMSMFRTQNSNDCAIKYHLAQCIAGSVFSEKSFKFYAYGRVLDFCCASFYARTKQVFYHHACSCVLTRPCQFLVIHSTLY